MKAIDLPEDIIILIAANLTPLDAFGFFKICTLFFTYYKWNYSNKQYAAIILDFFTKGNQRKCIKSLKHKHKMMVNNLNNRDVNILNLFDPTTFEVPTVERIENKNAKFTLWKNLTVRNYMYIDILEDMSLKAIFPGLSKDEFYDCYSSNCWSCGVIVHRKYTSLLSSDYHDGFKFISN